MRILVLTNLYPPQAVGGYEERCRDAVEGLRERGHEVFVLTSVHGWSTEKLEDFVHRRLWIHGLYGHPRRSILSLFLLELRNHDVLCQEIAWFRPDVVHVWNMGGLNKAMILTLQESGLPVVYDVSDHWIAQGLRTDDWMRWWNGQMRGAAARLSRGLLRATGLARVIKRIAPYGAWDKIRFDRIYFCSEFLKKSTMKAGYAVDHGPVIYCGIDTRKVTPRPARPEFKRLLFAGGLSAEKDPLTVIRALGVLKRRGVANLGLSIFGRGEPGYIAQLHSVAQELGVEEWVDYGAVTRDEMLKLFATHDALVFSSAWGEPFALPPLEAMAANLPVISTLEGGSAELIRHEINGLSFRAGDAEDLASKIIWLRDHPSKRAQMVEEGKRDVLAKFNRATMVSQIEAYLKGSLAHGPKR